MLQILTGRFFEAKGKLEEQETDAVLYSNFWFIRACYGLNGCAGCSLAG